MIDRFARAAIACLIFVVLAPAPANSACGPDQLNATTIIRPVAWQTVDRTSANSGQISCLIGDLGDGRRVKEIDVSSLRLLDIVPIINGSDKIHVQGKFSGLGLEVSFNRTASLTALGATVPGIYPVFITGLLSDGTAFCAETTVKVPPAGQIGCDCSAQGDCDNDGLVTMTDIAFLIAYAVGGGAEPPVDDFCSALNRGDVNCDLRINLVDVARLVLHVIKQPGFPLCDPCTN